MVHENVFYQQQRKNYKVNSIWQEKTEIIHHVLKPSKLPSWLKIYYELLGVFFYVHSHT
jgi:hypothetical protein